MKHFLHIMALFGIAFFAAVTDRFVPEAISPVGWILYGYAAAIINLREFGRLI